MKLVFLSIVLQGLWAAGHSRTVWGPVDQNLFASQNGEGIINGEPAAPGEIPYQAIMKTEKPAMFGNWTVTTICGGTLIRPNWILTAAHCEFAGYTTFAFMGSINFNDQTHWAVVTKKIIHEDFGPPFINDIALFRLGRDLSGPGIAVAVLAPPYMDSLEGEIVQASGFGVTDEQILFVPPDLMKVNLRVISNEVCRKVYEAENWPGLIVPSTICTTWSTQTGQTTCNGDSGGPLVYKVRGKDVIVGVTSFGLPDNCTKAPSGFARVSFFRKWIDTTIANNS